MWNGLESKSPDSSLNQKTQNSPKEQTTQDIKGALPLVMKDNLSPEERALLAKFRTDSGFAAKVRGDIKETNTFWKITVWMRVKDFAPEETSDPANIVSNISEISFLGKKILVITSGSDWLVLYRDPITFQKIKVQSWYLAGITSSHSMPIHVVWKNIFNVNVYDGNSSVFESKPILVDEKWNGVKLPVKGTDEFIQWIDTTPEAKNDFSKFLWKDIFRILKGKTGGEWSTGLYVDSKALQPINIPWIDGYIDKIVKHFDSPKLDNYSAKRESVIVKMNTGKHYLINGNTHKVISILD